jgi:hypothetical protein
VSAAVLRACALRARQPAPSGAQNFLDLVSNANSGRHNRHDEQFALRFQPWDVEGELGLHQPGVVAVMVVFSFTFTLLLTGLSP